MATKRPRSNDAEARVPLLEPAYDGPSDDAQAPAALGTLSKAREKDPAPLAGDFRMNPDGSAEIDLGDEEAGPIVEEQEDGSALIIERAEAAEGPHDERAEREAFMKNLADRIPPEEATRIARMLMDAIERDKEDRKERDLLYAEGLKRTGLGEPAPGGADFPGASKATHPMLVEACIDFAARTMKEVFPARGPVKAHIVGTATRTKIEKAERKKKYMNWQCTTQIKELRPVFEELLTQTPLGGSQYVKAWHDERFNRPRVEFVPVDKFHIPVAAASLESAARKTHEQDITREEFESRVDSGLYLDLNVGEAPGTPERTEAEVANDKIEGKTDNSYNEDGVRRVYETYVKLEVKGDRLAAPGRYAPYIATVDESSGRLLALYRNWDEDDKQFEELPWVVETKFVPWRGAYGLGLMHIAGGLASTATGAMRALLDSAHINNFPGALALSGARMAGQTVRGGPTEIAKIEGPVGIDDIRKLAMPYPFNPPSTVLYQLLEYAVAAGKGVINTAEEKIADASAQSPVGTTLALIEQGSITYSAIHARMHQTMAQLLAILHRIDKDFLEDEVTVEELGELVVRRADFQGPLDVMPVSDPNIFSETQRYAQLQAVLQLRQEFAPGSFKDNALLEQALRLLNYPQYEDILNTPLEAKKRNAVEENVVAPEPQTQLEVYDDQDHLEHMKTHVAFLSSPIFCANPMMAPVSMPKLLEHCKKHLIKYYQENVLAAAAALGQVGSPEELKSDDALLTTAAQTADAEMAKELAQVFQVLTQVQAQMQQLMPPAPSPEVDKEKVRAQAEAQKTQIREQGETQRLQTRLQAEQAADAQRAQMEGQAAAQDTQMKLATAAQAQQAEQATAAARLQAENTRHTEEMAAAAENARIAEQSERRAQDLEMMREEMRTTLQRELDDNRLANQRYIAELNANNAQVLALLNRLLDDKAAAAEDEGQVSAAKKQSGANGA
jgi:hypothetical protein